MKRLLFIILIFVAINNLAIGQSIPYRIRMPDSTYTAILVGTAGTRTAGDTVTGAWSTTYKMHEFLITETGRYQLYADAGGGSTYSLVSTWGKTYGKLVPGYDLYEFIEKLDSDEKVTSIALGDTCLTTAAIKDSIIGLQHMSTATVNYIGAGGSVTNNPGGADMYLQYNALSGFGGESALQWDYTNNLLKVGGTGAVARITCNGGDGGTNDQGIAVYGTFSDQTAHCFAAVSTHPLANNKAVAAYDADINITGSNYVDHAVGFQSRISFQGDSTIGDFYGIFVALDATGDSIKNAYGMRIDDMTGTTLKNKNYGIFISKLTGGTSQNWAIWVDSTKSYFGGPVLFNDSVYTTNAEFVVRPSTETVAMNSTTVDAILNMGPATGIYKGIRINGTFGTGNGYLFQANSYHPLAASGSLVGFDNETRTTGSNNCNNLIGYQSRPLHTSSGTLSDQYGFYSGFTNNGGTCANAFGLYVADPTGTGAVTENYGVFIAGMTKGGSENYSLYADGASKSYFGGPLILNDSLNVNSGVLIVSDALNKIGINSAISDSVVTITGGMYLSGGVSALNFTDRTQYCDEKTAIRTLEKINIPANTKGKFKNQDDVAILPPELRNGEYRDLSSTVSLLLAVVKAQQREIEDLKSKIK